MDKTIIATAAIITKGKKILLARRKNDSFEPLKWEFPGGKIEFGETPEQCILREIKEELDIEIKIKKLFSVTTHVFKKRSNRMQVILISFLASHTRGKIKNIECHDSRWVDKDKIENYDLIEGDKKIAQKLKIKGV